MSVFTRPCGSEGCRKKHWHYAFCIRNVRYRGSLPEARTKHEAEQAETKLRSEVFEGRFGRPTGSQPFVDFVEEVYLPWARQNKRSWKHDEFRAATICASRQFKGKTFAQITPVQVEKFKQERRATKSRRGTDRSAASVNRELELLSKIFTLARKYKVTEQSNPCADVQHLPEPSKRVRYLLDEEEPRLLAQLVGKRAHLRPLVVVALGTGMRLGDQLNLRWAQVDFQHNLVHVPNSKTGQEYDVPMNQDVRRELQALKRASASAEYVFLSVRTGTRIKEVKKGFKTACRLAGISDFRWHDLRHTFGTRMGAPATAPTRSRS
ncbi:MAG: site-specific integrase [Acidobacteria bacterium]|nr:site-specific integrase [Acidobacteriota bacterium]